MPISPSQRFAVICATLLSLFLGSLDSLIVSAAMPTIVAELGGMHLYPWVYSTYFLSRAVSLPIFGKLADLYRSRNLFLSAIGIFSLSSLAAGCAWNMTSLIVFRVAQGIGSGGIFALVYIVLADVSLPEKRGKTLSFASSVWGISSVLGPTLGGVIVTYFSWRWIFFINIPLGAASMWGIGSCFVESRKKPKDVSLDLPGVATLSTAILALLFALMTGGREYSWNSPSIIGLLVVFVMGMVLFVRFEGRAKDPILPVDFFREKGFRTGNMAVFFSSFAIFSMFAYAPLFLQGAQGMTPMQVGMMMLSLSLGWSLGSLALGLVLDRIGTRPSAITGGVVLFAGCILTLTFTPETGQAMSFAIFFVIGTGMGFVALSTMLVVQSSVEEKDLGAATASNQFARTIGGTVGVGICGSWISNRFATLLVEVNRLPENFGKIGSDQVERFLQPEVQSLLPQHLVQMVRSAVVKGAGDVFITVAAAAAFCLVVCILLPGKKKDSRDRGAWGAKG